MEALKSTYIFYYYCRTDKEDERAKLEEQKAEEDLENLLDDDYLREFMERRMREMMVAKQPSKRFGFLADLSGGEEFLDAIDKEEKAVTVVVFIYEDGTAGCEPMHKALRTVSKDYPATKGWMGLEFVNITVLEVGKNWCFA